jgi:Helicase conserved C-terminal domain
MKILQGIANEHDRKTIIFVETKRRCDDIARSINRRGFNAVAIHGNKSQNERDYTLNSFRSGRMNVQILVATDVASRGLGELKQSPLSVVRNIQIFISQNFMWPRSLALFSPIEHKMFPRLHQFLFICRIFSRFFERVENLFAIVYLGNLMYLKRKQNERKNENHRCINRRTFFLQ